MILALITLVGLSAGFAVSALRFRRKGRELHKFSESIESAKCPDTLILRAIEYAVASMLAGMLSAALLGAAVGLVVWGR